MIKWMIKWTTKIIVAFFKLILLMCIHFCFLCLNVFTIPVIILRKIFSRKKFYIQHYSLMLYPSTYTEGHSSLHGDIKKMDKDANAKVKKRRWRPFESIFFD